MARQRSGEIGDILQRFTEDFGLYTIAQAIPALLGVAALSIFTRVFPAAAYGRYALAMTFVALISTLIFGWIQQSILRFEPELNAHELAGNVISILILCNLLILALTSIGYLFTRQIPNEYQRFYFAAAALVMSQGTFSTYRTLFQARLQSGAVTIYSILLSVAKIAFAIILALMVFDDIVGWIWGSAIAAFLSVALMAYRSGITRFSLRFQSSLLWRFFRYGLPMIGWLLGLTLLNFADRLLLEFIHGSSAVGIYSSNYTLVHRGLLLVFTPLIQTIHPLLMNSWDSTNKEEMRDLMTSFTRYFLIIGVPATIFAGVVSRPLSTILLGAQHHEGYLIIPIVGTGLFFWNLAMIGHKGAELEERTGLMFLGISGVVLLNIVLNIPLIHLYGYEGAAAATLISFSAYTFFAYVISGWTIQWQFPSQTIRNTAVGGVFMALPAVLLYLTNAYTLSRVFGVALLGIGLYLLILYVLGEARPNELSAINSLVRRT